MCLWRYVNVSFFLCVFFMSIFCEYFSARVFLCANEYFFVSVYLYVCMCKCVFVFEAKRFY